MKILFFYLFLMLNLIDLQYIPGLRRLNQLLTIIRMFSLKLSGANIQNNSILRPYATIIKSKNLKMGTNVIIGSRSRIFNNANVEIGNNTEIGPNLVLRTGRHIIKDYNLPLAKQGADFAPIIIGENCYFGSDVTVLGGISITSKCLIGAKSLVNKNITIPGLYAGVPAKLIKKFPKN